MPEEPADGQPTDAELLAGLDRTQTTAWQELRSVADHLAGPDLAPEWVFGPGFPHPSYTERVLTAIRLLYEVGAVSPAYRWQRTAPPNATSFTPADAVRAATALVRGERFCDGLIAKALRDGTFGAILLTLSSWYGESPA